MKMTPRVSQIFRDEDHFLVVSHINPDGDAIGSLLGLAMALSEMGKNACPLVGGAIPDAFEFLPGTDTLVTDPGRMHPAPQWIVAVDAAEENRIWGDLSGVRDGARLVNIDHHATNPQYGDVNVVVPDATSTAEIIYRILKEAGYSPSVNVGKCLYAALYSDTGGFRFSGVRSSTLHIGAELLAAGFESNEVTGPLLEEYPISRVRMEQLMLERMEVLLDGRLIISTLYPDDFERLGAQPSELENLVDKLRTIRGVEAAVLITKVSDELTRVSFRSKGRLNVASIAQVFGGGGHPRAAGLRTPLTPTTLKVKIKHEVKAALEALAI